VIRLGLGDHDSIPGRHAGINLKAQVQKGDGNVSTSSFDSDCPLSRAQASLSQTTGELAMDNGNDILIRPHHHLVRIN
jgi:hypothetical protein